MKTPTPSKRARGKGKKPRVPSADARSESMNKATADEFEREGLGVASKE